MRASSLGRGTDPLRSRSCPHGRPAPAARQRRKFPPLTQANASPTSVVQPLPTVAASPAPTAGWDQESRAPSTDELELQREQIDKTLEREFEAMERADRVLFALGKRQLPKLSARGVAPNAPFL